MSRILGGVGSALARLLDIQGGRVDLNELRDSEGASIVTDLMPLLKAESLRIQTRGFDSGNLNQSTQVTLDILLPPVHHRIMGVAVGTDDATRVDSVSIYLREIGQFGTGLNSSMLWYWENGDPTFPQPAAFVIDTSLPAGLGTILTPLREKQSWRNLLYVGSQGTQKFGITRYGIEVNTTAFGAGTVRVRGHLVQLFPASLVGPQAVELPIENAIGG